MKNPANSTAISGSKGECCIIADMTKHNHIMNIVIIANSLLSMLKMWVSNFHSKISTDHFYYFKTFYSSN